jgi:S1-C subfamily serine protease
MNDDRESSGDGREPAPGEPPRLGPRPLERPCADPSDRAAFGRPDGVSSSFAPPAGHGGTRSSLATTQPPTAAVARAFGRPDDGGTGLQREPRTSTNGHGDHGDEAFWPGGTADDPWRSPESPVTGVAPTDDEPKPRPERPSGARLSVREVLFGGRVDPRALAVLGVVALLIGALGGLVGHWTAAGADGLTEPGATLTPTEESKERPPGSVPDLASRLLPSVVSLETTVGQEAGTGSGVVIDPQGYVLTNDHVVAPATGQSRGTIEAVFSDGARVPAQVVGADPMTDLAVVKLPVANPTVAPIGRSSDLAVGDGVMAIGSPLGLAGTEGSSGDAVIDAVQTDAAINPGNSGGPLVDSTGAVVGINTAIRSLGAEQGGGQGGSIGLGFAIPIDDARGIAEELIRTGRVAHADLGVNARSVTDGATDGAQIQNVVAGGPAAAAGILDGDVVVRVGGRPIAGADELVVAVREHKPGEQVPVEVVRQGRPLTVTATLGTK